jgi:hypothetical protein
MLYIDLYKMMGKPGTIVILCGLVFLLGVHTDTYAQLYKWVDENGNVNYSQSPPPPGIEGSTIKPPPPINPDSARKQLDNRISNLDKLADQRQQKDEQQLQDEQESANNDRLCKQARARLASYQQPRVSRTDPDGMYRRLSEEERQREISRSRQQINELCN